MKGFADEIRDGKATVEAVRRTSVQSERGVERRDIPCTDESSLYVFIRVVVAGEQAVGEKSHHAR